MIILTLDLERDRGMRGDSKMEKKVIQFELSIGKESCEKYIKLKSNQAHQFPSVQAWFSYATTFSRLYETWQDRSPLFRTSSNGRSQNI